MRRDLIQLCARCEAPTDRCEDDSLFVGDLGPLCVRCHDLWEDLERPERSELMQRSLNCPGCSEHGDGRLCLSCGKPN